MSVGHLHYVLLCCVCPSRRTRARSRLRLKNRRQTYRESTVEACTPSSLTALRAAPAQVRQLRCTTAAIRARRSGAVPQEAPAAVHAVRAGPHSAAPRPAPTPRPAQGSTWSRRSAPGHGEVRGRGRSSTARSCPSVAPGTGWSRVLTAAISAPRWGAVLRLPPHTHTTARCQRVLWSRPWRRRVPEPGPAHHPLPTERCATRSGTKRALHAASPPRRAAAVRQQKPHSRTPSASGPAAGRGEGVGGHAGMNGTSGLGEPGASGRAERGPSTWPWRRRLTQPGRAERCGHPSAHPPIIHPSSIPPPAPPLPQPRGAAPSPQRPLSGASAPCPERNTPA